MERYPMSVDRKLNVVKMSVILNITYGFNAIPQNLSKLLCGYWQTDSKTYMKSQKTQNSQHNVEEQVQWLTLLNL